MLGTGLLIASVWILLDNGTDEWREPREQGELNGRAAGFVFVSVVGATLGHFAYRRWRGEEASWNRITPQSLAIAGLVSFYLALFVGPPTTEQQEVMIAAEECARSQPSPVDVLPPEEVSPVTDAEIAAEPGLAAIGDRFPGVLSYFQSGAGADRTLITVWALGDAAGDHTALAEGLEWSLGEQGFVTSPLDLGGADVRSYTVPGAPGAIYFARQGCYAFAVLSQSAQAALARVQVILGAGPPGTESLT